MSILYKGPSIDASYQVSVHLAEGFSMRRLKCEKLTDDRRQVMAKAHFAFGKVSKKTEKFTGSNKVLLVLGQRTTVLIVRTSHYEIYGEDNFNQK